MFCQVHGGWHPSCNCRSLSFLICKLERARHLAGVQYIITLCSLLLPSREFRVSTTAILPAQTDFPSSVSLGQEDYLVTFTSTLKTIYLY